jgi:hypothetical protein
MKPGASPHRHPLTSIHPSIHPFIHHIKSSTWRSSPLPHWPEAPRWYVYALVFVCHMSSRRPWPRPPALPAVAPSTSAWCQIRGVQSARRGETGETRTSRAVRRILSHGRLSPSLGPRSVHWASVWCFRSFKANARHGRRTADGERRTADGFGCVGPWNAPASFHLLTHSLTHPDIRRLYHCSASTSRPARRRSMRTRSA